MLNGVPCVVCDVLLQLMWATVSIIGMLFMQPTDPQKGNPRAVVQLQQFSWTEGGLEEAIKVGGMRQGIFCHDFRAAEPHLACC